MYLAKIYDSFMQGGKSKRSHWRIIDKDENGKIYAVLTTHLFVPDVIRFQQIKEGSLKQVKFSCFDNPSGVYKQRIYRSHNGRTLNYKNIKAHTVDRKKFKIETRNLNHNRYDVQREMDEF